MRVLIVSPYPVWPPSHGGRVRVAGLARGLARAGADVTLLSPWHPRQPCGVLGPDIDHRVHALPSSALTAVGQRVAPGQALLSLEPAALLPRRLLRSLGRFDVYQFEFCAQAAWMDCVPPGSAVVYSAHNVEPEFFASEAHRYLLRRGPLRRLERLERAAVQRSDLVITCSEEDCLRLRELYGAHRSTVVPNGGSPSQARRRELRGPERRRLELKPGDRTAVFLGGPAEHNREAARFLVSEMLPRMGEEHRLILAGASADAVRGTTDSRVRALGYVADLAPVLAAADVGLNPVATASGSSVKVADYLGGGLPVVSTAAGARGLGGAPNVRVVPRSRFPEELTRFQPPPRLGPSPDWSAAGAMLRTELATL